MISKELYLIGRNAMDVHKMLKDLPDSDFPHWWQAKIVKAHEYLEGADISNIQEDINKFLTEFDFWHLDQISLTSHTGKDDWEASIGKIETLEYPEPLYRKVNKYFKNTSIEKLVFEYKEFLD